jgi:alkyl sulfatase BDS1-like metallo-beta-lactamase superfamily hydrolase
MKKSLVLLTIVTSVLVGCDKELSAQKSSANIAPESNASIANNETTNPYMGADVTLGEAANGAIVNQAVLDNTPKVTWTEPTIEQPAEGVWTFGGYGLAPITIIDTPEGLIAFDTGDSKHDGEILLEAIRTVTDKPIRAIIYGHSHTGLGAGVLAEGNKDVMLIGHPNLNDVMTENENSGGIPAYYAEIGPYLTGRAATQFNAFLPTEGPDAWILPLLLPANIESTYLPVNTPVEHMQEMTVLGQKMQFLTKWATDDRVAVDVWMPDRKIFLTTLLWFTPPQLYSVRGDQFRDPQEWIEGLKNARELGAEVLISSAGKPVIGKELIRETLEGYTDGAIFVMDQTLRGINNGEGPDELRHSVQFPEYLKETPNNFETYGEISSYSPAIFTHAVGWYDGDAANLKQLSNVDEARRLVPLLGGRDKVLAASREALANKEYLWSVQLVNHLYQLDPQDMEVRQLKADGLRAMSYVASGANDRAHLSTQALALEGKIVLPRLILPQPAAIQAAPSVFVDFLRTRIDPEKSGETNAVIIFNFDNGETSGLHIRRAIAEFIATPADYSKKADFNVTMSNATWAKLYRNEAAVADLVSSGDIKVEGDANDFINLYNVFDVYTPENNVTIPMVVK